MDKINLLFVCSKNQWRSPTASLIYKDDSRFNTRSAGLSNKSPHKISFKDIQWADLIMVFEDNHISRIVQLFKGLKIPKIINLNIEDNYKFMDKDLIELIKEGVEDYFYNRV